MRKFLTFAVVSFSLVLATKAAQPPNVILILADDMCVGDVAVFNGGRNRTPNIDRLIGGGLWFDRA